MLFVTKGNEKEMGFVVTQDLVKKLKDGLYDAKLKDIYVDEKKISYERNRYIKAVESYTVHFGEGEVSVFSAPGRSEIGGNHTDHQFYLQFHQKYSDYMLLYVDASQAILTMNLLS